jgi:hypothetical protein
MEDESGGLFNIEASSDESVDESEKVPRDFQSDEDFQKQRREWKAKNEVGEVSFIYYILSECTDRGSYYKIWKTLKFPICNPSKPESQTILHAIEELYFFRRYEEAGKVAEEVLKGRLNEEFRKTISDYLLRCEARSKAAGK